ncbi:hypothetical protein C0991_008447, partial [Blastosporella zonata]
LPLIPIANLKDSEILLSRAHAVLAYLVHFEVHSLPPASEARIPPSLSLSFLQVSGYWRDVALEDPLLCGMSMEKLLPVLAFREAAGRPLQKLYLDSASLQRISAVLHLVPQNVNVLEFDIWSTLHDEDLQDEAAHFVGNDFDFIV